ncbi:hypothetical protein BURPS668_A2491 [Burkholderia pseudomallei 668]|nr:hypothetical protein BURPS668_A2491 [Burkholderia pseudomallei 668]EEC34616.1 conserved hypothetical protein [Burkholderia pseudomallei 576]
MWALGMPRDSPVTASRRMHPGDGVGHAGKRVRVAVARREHARTGD